MGPRKAWSSNLFKGLTLHIDRLSSRALAKRILYASVLLFFIAFIMLPPIIGILSRLTLLRQVLSDPVLMARASSSIFWSFAVALLVSSLDLLIGIPLAWFIARGSSRWIDVVDALVDIPFIIPTVALGFSTLLFWGSPTSLPSLIGLSELSPGLYLVLLLHFAFSFPVVVRVMVGEFLSYERIYETAARTLGARALTVARTITLPMLKPGLVAAFLLSFARSLSETGATMMVAGSFENGAIFIVRAREEGLEGPMAFVSLILILASIAAFAIIRILGSRLRFPLQRAWPRIEGILSSQGSVRARDTAVILIFAFLVLLPSIFITFPALGALSDGTLGRALEGWGAWGNFWKAMVLSYGIGILATILNIATGLPVAILIARRKLGLFGTVLLDAAVNLPIIVPSVALGASLSFFWRSFGLLPEFWILVLSHATITYTYFVQAMAAAIEGLPEEMEEAARTLGSRPFNIFRHLTLPLTKYSVFSGALLTFTRSINETGAAMAVSKELKTAPVILVEWVKGAGSGSGSGSGAGGLSESALGISFLVLTSFLALLALRLLVYRGKRGGRKAGGAFASLR